MPAEKSLRALDFGGRVCDELKQVRLEPISSYDRWRLDFLHAEILRDGLDPPPEWLMQKIWRHQRVNRSELRSTDGRKLLVLHPGFWNQEAGPDFRNAMLQWDSDPPVTADVEIDVESSNWKSHGHSGNPNFTKVGLQVVWAKSVSAIRPGLPELELAPFLDSTVEELLVAMTGDIPFPESLRGKCSSPLKNLETEKYLDLLRQSAEVRLRNKAWRFTARARQAGWRQALWEGLFSALGYKQNVWPFRRLAELIPDLELDRETISANPDSKAAKDSLYRVQALLHGVAGLLPGEWNVREDPDRHRHLRRLWDFWWRESGAWTVWKLPAPLWKFHGVRPANLPQRRLALAAHWLLDARFMDNLQDWFLREESASKSWQGLCEMLTGYEDPFWASRWSYFSPPLDRPMLLIGPPRIADLAVNVLLPWFKARAAARHRSKEEQRAEWLYFHWPASEDNAVLRLARQRLLGGSSHPLPRKAFEQQGLLQIVQDFCRQHNSLCEDCRFPDLVRKWKGPE